MFGCGNAVVFAGFIAVLTITHYEVCVDVFGTQCRMNCRMDCRMDMEFCCVLWQIQDPPLKPNRPRSPTQPVEVGGFPRISRV